MELWFYKNADKEQMVRYTRNSKMRWEDMLMVKMKRMFTICLAILMALTLIFPVNAEAASKVKLNKTKLTLEVGKTATLKLKGAKVKKWSSSNKKVVTVSSKGKVKAKKAGTATIKAKAKNGKIYKCKVTVKKKDNKKDLYPDTSNYTKEEKQILEIFETTLRNAGFSKTTDVMTTEEIEEWGPNAGMGWGQEKVSLSNAQYIADGLIDYMRSSGYTMFYIEVLETSNGETTIVVYRG